MTKPMRLKLENAAKVFPCPPETELPRGKKPIRVMCKCDERLDAVMPQSWCPNRDAPVVASADDALRGGRCGIQVSQSTGGHRMTMARVAVHSAPPGPRRPRVS